ncbi:Zinc ribbon domain protein [Aquisphaera giovannonii]|uniref:Zinc ribbon domain protein n=1 Tax=Aquisphaera giovannonii TaxID=406548 RepID=A0A5B9W9A1_9BACT|nr:zinc ribbon domain-containing protein [Aquisphaera giovannonii]QEH36655.1 Zinc ribbon domain protein [Aquisphaera giovannonii]
MPTYDYVCDACNHEFEAFESIKADPQTVCPTCHEPKLRRKIGPGAAILFKGSGFYQTDYRSESYKQAAKSDKPASESSSSSTKSDGGSSGSSSSPAAPAASSPSSSSASGSSNGKP